MDRFGGSDLFSFIYLTLIKVYLILIRCRIRAWWILAVGHSQGWEKGDFSSPGHP